MGQKGGGEIGRTLLSRLAGDACVSLFVFEIRKHTRAIFFLFGSLIRLGFIFAVRHKCADADIILGAGVVNTLIDILIRISQHLLIATGEEAADARQRYCADEAYFIP